MFIGQSEGGVIAGEPDLWQSDHTKSSASTLSSGGESYPYGVVHMIGCFENLSEITYESDSPPPSTIGLFFPTEVVVQYDPQGRSG